ncbi:methyltransferase N6AMT1 isoform X1 [Electrophorus electricus]|uniref:methyltransferase N6AMT1 isoform X1 n=1 Tax=Electrophorus electricus TaxID=8005 RepID=UPI0015D0D06C|nr:methyltransferase N6AMT1 isoform X1 [Electrophorus electricus]XP_026861386.2 methyltransferase N6AMT1 isoform X1 [Electrophorus electricus]XP_035390724.1 methyltransferase N6AMT1 isoform X1 [Electrophorus electricus]
MYPTPLYSHAGRGPFSEVYEPAEDSFLLIDALEKDANLLQQHRPALCLEVGSGSGIVSAFLASVTGPEVLYLCTDLNPAAAQCTKETSRCNHLHLQPLVTDLVIASHLLLRSPLWTSPVAFPLLNHLCSALKEVECLMPRLNGKVDVLLFNPPYVVTPSEEVVSRGIEASWAGGLRGREVMDRFFPMVPSLLSNQGLFYLVTVSDNNPDEILALLGESGLTGQMCLSRQAGRERLSVLRFTKCDTTGP